MTTHTASKLFDPAEARNALGRWARGGISPDVHLARRPEEADARQIFDGFEHDGMRTRVDSVQAGSGGRVRVEGVVRDVEADATIGRFARTFDPLTATVTHDVLELRPRYQRRGFATVFNARAERGYAALGYRHLQLDAEWDGAAAWAHSGWQWRGGRFPENFRVALRNLVDKPENLRSWFRHSHTQRTMDGKYELVDDPLTGAQEAAFERTHAELRALVARLDAGETPSPEDVADLGQARRDVMPPTTRDPVSLSFGEMLLRDIGWKAEKQVRPELDPVKGLGTVLMTLTVAGLAHHLGRRAQVREDAEALPAAKAWTPDLHPRGRGGEFAPHHAAAIFSGFEHAGLKIGRASASDTATPVPGQIRVRANVWEGKRRVGRIERLFDPVLRTVTHERLTLHEDAQRRGFATALNAHAEREYARHGFDRIYLTAAMSAGGVVWAKAGYQWRDGIMPPHYVDVLRRWVKPGGLNGMYPSGGDARRRTADDARALLTRLDAGDVPTPLEFARVGHRDPRPDGVTPGAFVMRGLGWEGEKRLVVDKTLVGVLMRLHVAGTNPVERKDVVRTPEGARRYHAPIGTTITLHRLTQDGIHALKRELDDQGVDETHPIRSVLQIPRGNSHVAVARDADGRIVGGAAALIEGRRREGRSVSLTNMRVLEDARRTGVGHELITHLAREVDGPHGTMSVHGAVDDAKPFYARTGASFTPDSGHGLWSREAIDAMKRGDAPPLGVNPTREEYDHQTRVEQARRYPEYARDLAKDDPLWQAAVDEAHPPVDDADPARVNQEWADRVAERVADNYDEDDRADARAALERMLPDADVWLRVPAELLDDILQEGRIRTQHESGSSNGMFDPDLRALIEKALFDVDPNEDPKTAPVYGYLSADEAGNLDYDAYDSTQAQNLMQYGAVALRLMPHVRERTTFTVGDSIDDSYVLFSDDEMLKARTRGAGYAEGTPMFDHMLGIGRSMADEHPPAAAPQALEGPITDAALDDAVSTLQEAEMSDVNRLDELWIRYVEAQIHGGITLDDIAEIHVRSMHPAQRKAIEDAYGLPVIPLHGDDE